MNSQTITILGSGVALGVYVPALLVHQQLKKHLPADLVILEALYSDEKQALIQRRKQAFHKSFAAALMGQRMARDVRAELDPTRVQALFDSWAAQDRTEFLVFSGFWMSLLDEYRRFRAPKTIHGMTCRLDASVSTSWRTYKNAHPNNLDWWIFSRSKIEVGFQVEVDGVYPLAFEARNHALVVHGGGWGMGTYRDAIPELRKQGLSLEVVAYQAEEARGSGQDTSYYLLDPSWVPWRKGPAGCHEFPRLGQVHTDGSITYECPTDHHRLLDIIARSKAIVSKPGGASLLDSFASATPLIMLDAFGSYETHNAELWEHLGFGIAYTRWKELGFSTAVLETMHRKIVAYAKTCPDFAASLLSHQERKLAS